MRIAYVKTHEAYDRCHIVRDDGTEDAYRFHAYGGALPHELVHFAVEVAFGLRRGVWGCVAAGVDLARANDHANRKGGADKYRDAFGDALPEVLYSEALTTIAWSASVEECVAAVRALAPAREAASVSLPTRAEVERARTLVSELRERWAALGPREALHLEL
jgi:hypothetical protein